MSKNRTVPEEFLNDFVRLHEEIQKLELPSEHPISVYSNSMFFCLEEKLAAMERREEFQKRRANRA
jgi:hypothetical protein